MNNQIELSARFEASEAQLSLNYSVTNKSGRDTYLLNRLYRTLPKWELSPNIIYIQLDSTTQTIRLSKKLADIPKDKDVTAPIAPFVTPVRAGTSFEEDVRIPLPVNEYQEYAGNQPDADAPIVTYQSVCLSIGFYWRLDETVEDLREVPGATVICPRNPPGLLPQFGELQTESQRIDIPVIEPINGT